MQLMEPELELKRGDAPLYIMKCWAHGHPGVYTARTWLGLGWAIFIHRFTHLIDTGKWSD